MIVTPILEIGRWNHVRVIRDYRMSFALVDQLVHYAHVIVIMRKSYR